MDSSLHPFFFGHSVLVLLVLRECTSVCHDMIVVTFCFIYLVGLLMVLEEPSSLPFTTVDDLLVDLPPIG